MNLSQFHFRQLSLGASNYRSGAEYGGVTYDTQRHTQNTPQKGHLSTPAGRAVGGGVISDTQRQYIYDSYACSYSGLSAPILASLRRVLCAYPDSYSAGDAEHRLGWMAEGHTE